MGIARVLITPELFAAALPFPDGARIVNAGMDPSGRYVVLTVEHAGLHAAADARDLPMARPTFRRDDDHPRPGIIFVSWGQDD